MSKTENGVYLTKQANVCAILIDKVTEYFKDDSHKRDFEEWYRRKYGKEYQWNHR